MIVPRNRLLFWFAVIAVPFSVLAGAIPEMLVLCAVVLAALVALVLIDAFLSRSVLNGVDVDVPPVTRMNMEKDGQLEVKLRNPDSRARKLRVALSLPEEFSSSYDELEVGLPEGSEWSRLPWPCKPSRRGKFALRAAHVESISPMGFWDVRRTLPLQGEIRVFPNLQKEQKGLGLLFHGAIGIHSLRQVGKGREFEKLRDYVPGDGLDDIHWKATARRGRPITKVFQIERTQEVYVAIDASRLSAREDAIERQLSAALLLGMAAEQQGDLFGLLTFSDQVQRFVRARNGSAHYQVCRDAIYALQPSEVNPDFDEVCAFIRLRLRRRALVIFLTSLDDPVLQEDFVRNIDLISRQHLVIVGMMRPSGLAPLFSEPISNSEQLYEQLGGHMRWHNLEELSGVLQRRGVKFNLFDSERMGLHLVSEYLNVKKRQIL
jgi:uncharacterized protein (DUF58 family)